jgi:Spx/MgsR family transcriptional regulator
MITIYGIKNCDSVKKAIKYMKQHHLDYQFIDFKETPPNVHEIHYWASKVEMKKLFNTRGTTYRTLKLKELDLDDKEKEAWLVKEPMLLKRPIITYEDKVIVAFDEVLYDRLFRGEKG